MELSKISKDLINYMDKYNNEFLFSGTVSVKSGNEVLFEKGYGKACIEHDIPNKVDTVHRLYSLTKQFTAAAILMLEEKGLLSVEDKLVKYFPEFDEIITLSQMLNHTSGIFNYTNIPFSHTKIYNLHMTNEEELELFKDEPLAFEPGSNFEYCNSSYFLLSLIIEKVSGLSYEKFLTENIFKPLNMNDTYVDDGIKIIKNMSTGHYINGMDLIHCNHIEMNNLRGSGNICSTVGDINKWVDGLFGGKLICKSQLDKMMKPNQWNYGYGVFVEEINNTECVNHTGGAEGYLTQLNYYPKYDLTVCVLSNLGFTNTYSICNNLASIVLGQEYSMPQKPERYEMSRENLNKILGEYRDEETVIQVYEKDDRLCFMLDGESVFYIYPISEDTFQNELLDESYSVEIEDGRILNFWGVDKAENNK